MAQPWYATREDVKGALDVAETARNNDAIDRALGTGTRQVEKLLRRRFYPLTATRYFDWPDIRRARAWRLWLDEHEIVSVSSLTVAGVLVPPGDYLLEPVNSGPPYNRIEINLASSSVFAAGATHQRAIAIAGVWHLADDEPVGELTAILDDALDDAASATWTTSRLGVGDILRIGAERLIITAKTFVDSTQNTTGALLASSSDITVPVASGAAFDPGVVLRIDAERMLVVDVAGNNLIVRRNWDGSVLAAHNSAADVYTLTGVRIDRAQLGTTLAEHASGATIYRHVVPSLVRDLAIAEAVTQLQQEASAYARLVGEGESAREAAGRGLRDLRRDVAEALGRRARLGAV